MGGGTSRFSRSSADDGDKERLKEIIAEENRKLQLEQTNAKSSGESNDDSALKVDLDATGEAEEEKPAYDALGNPRVSFMKNPRRSSYRQLPEDKEPTIEVTVEAGDGNVQVYEGGEVLTKSTAPELPVNFDTAKVEREKDRNQAKKKFKTQKTMDIIKKPVAEDSGDKTPQFSQTGLTRAINWDPKRNQEAMEGIEFGSLHLTEPGKYMGNSSLEVNLFGGFGGGDDDDDGGLDEMFAQKGISMGEFHILNAGSELLKAQAEKVSFHTGPGADDDGEEREGMVDFGNFYIEGAGQQLKAASLPVSFGGSLGAVDNSGGGDFEVSFGGGNDDDDRFAGREMPAMGDFHIFAPGKQLMQPGSAGFFDEPKDEQLADMPVSFGDFFIAGAPGAQTAKSTVVSIGGGDLNVSIGGFGGDGDGPMGMAAEMPVLRINNPQKTMYQPRRGSIPGDEDEDDHDVGLQAVNPGATLARKGSVSNLEAMEEVDFGFGGGDDDEEEKEEQQDVEKVVKAAKRDDDSDDEEDEEEEDSDPPPPKPKKKPAKKQESSSEEEDDADSSDSDSGSDSD